ncbi:hypothetical protein T459_12115 [Capsicum annuum]|uniref:Protein ARV n=1 Tax=Capsicum annuum TaxID=4072 RepID=A0A2G2ZNV0_CAPAN|nr:hypothetical protein T459_12115 [Capsicum annuum]
MHHYRGEPLDLDNCEVYFLCDAVNFQVAQFDNLDCSTMWWFCEPSLESAKGVVACLRKVLDFLDEDWITFGFRFQNLSAILIELIEIRVEALDSVHSGYGDTHEDSKLILVIDLILHIIKAYRHLFYNRFSQQTLHNEVLLWKLSMGFLILDACIVLVSSLCSPISSLVVEIINGLCDFRCLYRSSL